MDRTRIFVTGGSGFVGSRLLEALGRLGRPISVLDRSGSSQGRSSDATPFDVVAGNLLEPSSYSEALRAAHTVIHLAALTGRASRKEHFRVNAEGTETLLKQCRDAGVRRVLFVSSIAVTFADLAHYHYAQAKVRAEEAVRRSGLSFAILRPTMIFGQGSAVLGRLSALATLPVVPVFGTGRPVVQPIHVDDVVAAIVTILEHDMFSGETFEIGGPTALPIEELLLAIRGRRSDATSRTVHVPMGLALPPLRVAAALRVERWLPVTAGQMASFRFNGTAAPKALLDQRRPALRSLEEMLATPNNDAAATPATPDLHRECHVFTWHLLGRMPSDYVTGKYAAAHGALPSLSEGTPFDRFLVNFARWHWLTARVADAHASVFAPASLLRRKLVLLLAVLETCPPSYQDVDAAVGGKGPLVALRLAVKGAAGVVSLTAGTLFLAPTRLVLAIVGRRSR